MPAHGKYAELDGKELSPEKVRETLDTVASTANHGEAAKKLGIM